MGGRGDVRGGCGLGRTRRTEDLDLLEKSKNPTLTRWGIKEGNEMPRNGKQMEKLNGGDTSKTRNTTNKSEAATHG